MRSFMGFGLLLCLAIVGVVNAGLNPIVIKGNAFFDSVTNDRFYIRGVDYQVRTPHLLLCSVKVNLVSRVDRLL